MIEFSYPTPFRPAGPSQRSCQADPSAPRLRGARGLELLLDPLSGWAPAHRWGIVRELSAPDAAVTARSCVASAVSPPTAGPADTLPTELLRLRSVETELTHRESTTTHRA